MDPLSVTAGIIGILATATKLGNILHGTISTTKNAPRILLSLMSEVYEVQAALSSLHILIKDLSSARPHRAALIQLDYLIVTLTESILTLSELENIIAPIAAPLGAKVPLTARLKLARAEGSCVKIVERLQRHKSSMSLMLNILQCASDADASRSQSSLEATIEQLLQSNQQLCRRLGNLEDSFDARSTIRKDADNLSLPSRQDDSSTIRSAQNSSAGKRMSFLAAIRDRFAFDDDLHSSRVYRKARRSGCDHSLVSSAIRTQSWSIFSGLSLADISVISVVALPLYPKDIKELPTYIEDVRVDKPDISAYTATSTRANEQRKPAMEDLSALVSSTTSYSNPTESVRQIQARRKDPATRPRARGQRKKHSPPKTSHAISYPSILSQGGYGIPKRTVPTQMLREESSWPSF